MLSNFVTSAVSNYDIHREYFFRLLLSSALYFFIIFIFCYLLFSSSEYSFYFVLNSIDVIVNLDNKPSHEISNNTRTCVQSFFFVFLFLLFSCSHQHQHTNYKSHRNEVKLPQKPMLPSGQCLFSVDCQLVIISFQITLILKSPLRCDEIIYKLFSLFLSCVFFCVLRMRNCFTDQTSFLSFFLTRK